MKTKSITIALTLATAAAAHAQVTTNVKTVSRYDAVTNANVVDVRLPSPAFYTSFVTAVANAWNANRGGVVNFDLPQTSPWPSPALGTNLILGSYGIAGSQMIKIGVPMIGDINSHATVVPISEKGDMLSKKIGAMSLTLSASTGLIRQAGLTVLQQANIPQKVTDLSAVGSRAAGDVHVCDSSGSGCAGHLCGGHGARWLRDHGGAHHQRQCNHGSPGSGAH